MPNKNMSNNGGEKQLREEDVRRFQMWFHINDICNEEPFLVEGLTVQQYLAMKHEDQEAYNYVLNKFYPEHSSNENSPIQSLWKSIDNVEYTLVDIPTSSISESISLHVFPNESPSVTPSSVPSIDESSSSVAVPSNVISPPFSDVAFSSPSCSGKKVKSIVWNYFSKKNAMSATCKLCNNILKSSGNTTNLKKHLSSKHDLFFPASVTETTDETNPPKNKKLKTGLTPISEAFNRISEFSDKGMKANKITNVILYMIAKDVMPLSTVEKDGFKQLMKTVCPLYSLPSRKTMTNLQHTKYESLKEIMVNKLSTTTSYCLTCDIWTDISQQSYLGVTLHFLSQEENSLENRFLDLFPLYTNHTSSYITDSLLSVVNSFKLDTSKIMAVVSDSAANMKKAVIDGFGVNKRLPCFAHLISNLVPSILKGMPSVTDMINKVKNIVSFCKKSVVASDHLKILQIRDGKSNEEILKFIQCVETRWNSCLHMLERFLILKDYVYSLMLKCDNFPQMLDIEECTILEELTIVMKPIELVINEISGDSYPTCSIIIPLIHCLNIKISHLTLKTEIAKQFQKSLSSAILTKFTDLEKIPILAISCILDPRYKKLHFESSIHSANALLAINTMLKKNSSLTVTSKENFVDHSVNNNNLWDYHDEIVKKSTDHNILTSDGMSLELKTYINQPVINRNDNPMLFWVRNKHEFVNLHMIALKYICIVGTSVPSERLFSKAGGIKSRERNRLCEKNLNELLFLNSTTKEDWKF